MSRVCQRDNPLGVSKAEEHNSLALPDSGAPGVLYTASGSLRLPEEAGRESRGFNGLMMREGLLVNGGGGPEPPVRRSVSGRSILKSGEGPVVSPQSPRLSFADNLGKPLEDVAAIPARGSVSFPDGDCYGKEEDVLHRREAQGRQLERDAAQQEQALLDQEEEERERQAEFERRRAANGGQLTVEEEQELEELR